LNAAECALQVGEIFALPDTCLKIKEIIDDEVSDIDEIAELISYDPVLSSKLLKLANSALYNFPKQVESVQKAVQVLGDKQVYNLVVASGAAEAFASLQPNVIALDKFWEHSINTALIAKHLAYQLGVKKDEPIYLSGLLHNIGELVVVQVKPDIARICGQYQKGKKPWLKQQELLGFSYADCTVELLKQWQLPDRIIQPLKQLNQPEYSAANKISLILHLASCLALSEANADAFHLYDLVDKQILEVLGLSKDDLHDASSFAFLEGMSILSLLNPALFSIF
jgi:HD-like signal output (HDOD) protein